MSKVKAIALFSGGLDSILAVKIILEQGIEVEALNFTSPFCLCEEKVGCTISENAEKLGVKLIKIPVDEDFFDIVRSPKHGYGRYMNPCIDCRIYILKKAKEYAEEVGAQFIFTGEVLGERPMSQRREALEVIDKEAGLTGKILRPLSAQHFSVTDAESEKLVNRCKLLDIKGRSRKKQIELAQSFGIKDYPCPSGGCLLTYREFAAKVKDILQNKGKLSFREVALLKVGRHFRFDEHKIIVGRNEGENKQLLSLRGEEDYCFEAVGCGSPITLLQGQGNNEAFRVAAALTARYSDCGDMVKVSFKGKGKSGTIQVDPCSDDTLEEMRIKWQK